MRSKKRTIGILIVVIVVLLGFAGSLLVYRNKLSSEKTENSSDNNFDYYYDIEDEIDKEIDDVLHSTNLSIDESKNKILDILHKFEKEKKIVKDSIEYMENEKIICFQYLHGLDCIINLEKRTPGFSGIADKEKYCAEYKYYDKTTGKFFEYYDDVNKVFRTLDMPSKVNSINFSDSKYPFPEGVISELNLTAKYMYGINDLSVKCDFLKTYQKYQKNWNDIHLKTDIDTYCTVEDFKTGLLNYDIIFIEEHGEVKGLLNKVSLILTLEECNRTSEKQYKSDIRNLSKVMYKDDLKNYWAIKPLFFEKYYENNRLKNTIVWIGSCKGYMQDDLVNIFEKCGASAVIGYDNSVNTQYDMLLHNGFVYSLMHGDTVSDALEFSKSIWKSDDRTYCYSSNPEFKVDKKEEPHGAVAKVNPNGKNARLINLPYYSNVSGKVTDENNNPIKGAEIIINNVRGMSYGITATTNENGEYTLECPQDSYKIGVKADGYEVIETDDFVNVVYGEETIYNIILKKNMETQPKLNIADVIISQYKNVVKGSNILGIDKVGLIDIDLDGELEFAVFSFGKRNSNDARNSNHFDFYDINTENNTLDLIELSEDTGADAIKLKLYQDNNGNKFYIGYNFTSWFGESMIKIQYIDGKINIETLARNEWDLRYIIKESEKWREATKEEYYNYTSQFTELENNFITENYETFNNMSNSEKESFLLQN